MGIFREKDDELAGRNLEIDPRLGFQREGIFFLQVFPRLGSVESFPKHGLAAFDNVLNVGVTPVGLPLGLAKGLGLVSVDQDVKIVGVDVDPTVRKASGIDGAQPLKGPGETGAQTFVPGTAGKGV